MNLHRAINRQIKHHSFEAVATAIYRAANAEIFANREAEKWWLTAHDEKDVWARTFALEQCLYKCVWQRIGQGSLGAENGFRGKNGLTLPETEQQLWNQVKAQLKADWPC